jgi:hypothetical protein
MGNWQGDRWVRNSWDLRKYFFQLNASWKPEQKLLAKKPCGAIFAALIN